MGKISNNIIILIIIMLFLLSISNYTNAIGVRPLDINLKMEKGDSKEFVLKISPENKETDIKLNIYNPKQNIYGGIEYKEDSSKKHAISNWFNLPKKVTIPPGDTEIINGEVTVPYEIKGDHTAIIMISPVIKNRGSGITFKVRYAVKVNINIESPGLREEVEINEFKLKSNKDNEPMLSTIINNPSSLHYPAYGEVTIRNENRRLIQRVPMKSQHARQSGQKATRIYPGSKVRFTGKVTEVLHPGTYNLRLFLTYADGKQEIVSKQVEVGDEFVQEGNVKHIELKPTNINDSLRPGGASTQVLRLRNRTGKQLQIKLGAKEVKPKYKHSIYKNLNVELRGDKKFKIEPRRSGRSVLILRSPREVKPGGYYGKLNIGVFDKEGNKLSTRNVNIDMLVGEDWKEDVKVQGITSLKDKKEHVFSLSVKNNGDAHFAPQARVYLKDKSGEIIHTLNMSLPEGKNKILPGMSSRLVTRRNDIKPGKYKAEVTIMKDGEELKKAEFEITVKGVKEGEIA